MYNDGKAEACEAVYEVALMGVLAMDDTKACDTTKSTIRTAMAKAKHQHTAGDRAWTYRDAMDTVLAMPVR